MKKHAVVKYCLPYVSTWTAHRFLNRHVLQQCCLSYSGVSETQEDEEKIDVYGCGRYGKKCWWWMLLPCSTRDHEKREWGDKSRKKREKSREGEIGTLISKRILRLSQRNPISHCVAGTCTRCEERGRMMLMWVRGCWCARAGRNHAWQFFKFEISRFGSQNGIANFQGPCAATQQHQLQHQHQQSAPTATVTSLRTVYHMHWRTQQGSEAVYGMN